MEKVGDILARFKAAGHDGALSFSTEGRAEFIDFNKPVKFADECEECPDCGEPWCTECEEHYADCSCPGPMSEREE